MVKLGRVRTVVRDCDEQTVLSQSLRLQHSKCTELQAGSPSVTTAAVSKWNLSTPANTLAGKEKRHKYFLSTQTHTDSHTLGGGGMECGIQ